MQISRQLLLACAVATCLTPVMLRAYDNEAQIRARQALEDKMKQMDAQAPQTTSSPPAVVKKSAPAQKPKKAPVQKPQPAAQTPAPPVVKSAPAEPAPENPPAQAAPVFAPEISQPATPMPATPAASSRSAADQKLREALHEKMTETPAVPAAPEPVAPVVTAPVAPEHPTAPVAPAAPAAPVYSPVPAMTPAPQSESAPVYSSTPATAPAPSAENQKLREALDTKMQQNAASSQPSVQRGKTGNSQVATKENPPMKPAPERASKKPLPEPVVSLPQLNGPASSLSAAKQQKLDELLQQYRADQLTPEQYHEQRAKVLSEP